MPRIAFIPAENYTFERSRYLSFRNCPFKTVLLHICLLRRCLRSVIGDSLDCKELNFNLLFVALANPDLQRLTYAGLGCEIVFNALSMALSDALPRNFCLSVTGECPGTITCCPKDESSHSARQVCGPHTSLSDAIRYPLKLGTTREQTITTSEQRSPSCPLEYFKCTD